MEQIENTLQFHPFFTTSGSSRLNVLVSRVSGMLLLNDKTRIILNLTLKLSSYPFGLLMQIDLQIKIYCWWYLTDFQRFLLKNGKWEDLPKTQRIHSESFSLFL